MTSCVLKLDLRRCRAASIGAAAVIVLIGGRAFAQPVPTTVVVPPNLTTTPMVPMTGATQTIMTKAMMGMGGGLAGDFQLVGNDNAIQIQGPMTPQRRPGYSTKSGFQLTILTNPSAQFGYQPITVTASLKRPARSEHTVRFEFFAGTYYNNGKSIVIEETLRLNKGDTSATVTLLAPQYQDWQRCGWTVTADGKEDDELSVDYASFGQQAASFSFTALIVSDQSNLANFQGALQAVGNGSAAVRTRRLNELSANWLHYTTLDVVALDASDLGLLATRHPSELQALLRWVRTGGNLWLVNAGQNWEKLPVAERALGLRRPESADSVPSDADEANKAAESRGWTFAPLSERQLEPVEGALTLSGFDTGDAQLPALMAGGSVDASQTSSPWIETSKRYFVVRGFGMGVVTAFRGELASPSGEIVTAIQRSLLMPRLTSAARHGNRPDSANSEFNNWLIPGVGVAPVGQFQFLITLFVLGIGPLNYWWLKRQKKLPLLLATVPAAAAIVTLLLLLFGVVADGFAIRARARSFTMLDQAASESVTWSRLSYYAGIDPRGGMSMPTDTAVYPILSDWAAGRYNQGPRNERQLSWGRDQRLRRGWLPSRTPTQYLTMNSRSSKKRLELRATAKGLRIVNRLGANVTHLVVQDHDGKLYWCENLAADEGRVVPEAEAEKISSQLRQLFSDNYPTFPSGADTSIFTGAYLSETMSKNLMEAQLDAINSPVVQRWVNGSYIAVTDRGIEVDLGVEDVHEEDSFHVVSGKW